MLARLFQGAASWALAPLAHSLRDARQREAQTSPATKASQRLLWHHYHNLALEGRSPPLRAAGLRVFSQFEEDGKLLMIFATLGIARGSFLDIGAGDGILSNCANLALNFGWHGLFIDGDAERIRRGEAFYAGHPDSWLYPPRFLHAMVTRESINDLLTQANVPRDVNLMSIDIDGNDYWVWDAMETVTPAVVIIETHIEFGLRSIVVPYDKDYAYPGKHPDYHGASPVAMAKLASRKGYRLVGSSDYGFNTIYVRRGMAEDLLPEVSVESILEHPRNRERARLFEPIKDWDYVEV